MVPMVGARKSLMYFLQFILLQRRQEKVIPIQHFYNGVDYSGREVHWTTVRTRAFF